jgi:GGDEF domain-containing protein
MGISAFPDCGQTADELLRAADSGLYRAKSEGRNRVMLPS